LNWLSPSSRDCCARPLNEPSTTSNNESPNSSSTSGQQNAADTFDTADTPHDNSKNALAGLGEPVRPTRFDFEIAEFEKSDRQNAVPQKPHPLCHRLNDPTLAKRRCLSRSPRRQKPASAPLHRLTAPNCRMLLDAIHSSGPEFRQFPQAALCSVMATIPRDFPRRPRR
jgi:hypothetical protein